MIALLLVGGLALGACSSGGDSKPAPSVDPEVQALLEGGTVPSSSDTTVASSDTTGTATNPDLANVNPDCLRKELQKRADNGDFRQGDLALWLQGLAPDGLVAQAASEIAASGVCN